ncbi:PaaI family thioesterase [Halalkalibacter akibai]|uniref:Thioesterase domain-containing protein n=1 Tax=Halalkalibacter akibai (strain ATCC 43226 / DSM 21942 / CIP 109018 / JCM 9157 / 1139) TaxID=1236973 RepID=W4QR55_HALA3|nr:PaaI family thioesterase [Halalkalibacter akibai]GAE33824.1 hypothetical protein JCM9157_850 [Halalkalibacter akibai JCM 9157]
MAIEATELLHKIQDFIHDADEEEKKILFNLVEGFENKRTGKFKTYLAAMTQIETRFLENGDFEVVLPIQPLIENPLKMVHGGMTATLLDTAMGSLVNQSLPQDLAAVTAEMNVHYIKPGVGKFLRCVASLSHQGKQLCVTEAKVYSDQNKLIAMATGTFFIINRPS